MKIDTQGMSGPVDPNYKGKPIFGLANFPRLKKYYYNTSLLYTSPSPPDKRQSRITSSP